MPSSGQINVPNAASTKSGLASQIMSNLSRGKSPANMANRQPDSLTSCRVLQYPPRGGYLTLACDRDTTVTTLLSQQTSLRFTGGEANAASDVGCVGSS
jgi:hypothetical protein